MNKLVKAGLATLSLSAVSIAQAVDFDVQIENLTQGIYFTPIVVAAHTADASLFALGSPASDALQAMAEGGALDGLVDALTTASATIETNPAAGLLGPGMSTMTSLNTDAASANAYLSIAAMMLPTNDGFMALSNWAIPEEAGRYVVNLNAYDSGTEGNDELVGSPTPGEAGFPAPGPVGDASGTGGTGVNVSAEGFVHIHRGVLGDTDATGGISDIDATRHRWLNPVARVIVTVN